MKMSMCDVSKSATSGTEECKRVSCLQRPMPFCMKKIHDGFVGCAAMLLDISQSNTLLQRVGFLLVGIDN
jgi:hypothetical protein